MKLLRTLRRSGLATTLAAAFVFLGMGFATAPASASTANDAFQVVAADDDVSVQSWTYSCFGNRGTFRDGTQVLYIDWSGSAVPECFGVAPSGAIYHTWQGANAWHEMPGNGRADDMSYLYDYDNGNRTVEVWTGTYWCQDYFSGSGWAGYWYAC